MSFDVRRLVALGRVSAFDLDPDGSWLAVEVARADDEAARYRSELWAVQPGGERSRIGDGSFHDTAPVFRSDGALLFLSDRTAPDHGPEDKADKETKRQIWVRHPDGRLERLSDEPLGVSEFQVARTGRIAYVAPVLPGIPHDQQREAAADRAKRGPSLLRYRDMPVRFWDHWLGEARPHLILREPDGARTDLTPHADREYDTHVDWNLSEDGRTLVATRTRIGDLRVPLEALDVFDLDRGRHRIFGQEPGLGHYSPKISPDGARIATGRARITRAGLGRHHVHLFDLATGEGRDLATHWDRWPAPAGWLDDGRVLCTADDRGSVPLFAVDPADGAVQRLTPEERSHGPVRVKGGRIYAIRHGILEPPEVVSLPAEGGPARAETSLAGITPAELEAIAVVEATEVPGSDGAAVPLFVVRPRKADGPRPLLLWIHGGPRGQWGETWHWRWNSVVAVAAGYVVGLPNPRGSTGLGQAFTDAIWGNTWGDQCYRDVMDCADALVAREDVDAARTCAMGGSFGGYMTNWIGTQTDRFGCLITHASLYSFHQFGWTTDLPAWWQLDFGGTPWGDRDDYERYSPDKYLPDWKSPVLVIHGEKDYRVPIGEGLALFEGLRQHGVDAELAVFPDENHWILKPRNVVAWYDLVFEFLERHLGPRP